MKKYIPFIVIAVVVLGGLGVYFLAQKKDTAKNDVSATNSKDENQEAALKYKDACKLFSREDLAATFGGTFGEGEEEYAPSTATPGTPDYEELKGSACKFEQDNDGTTTGMTQSLGLAVAINNYASVDDANKFMKDLHDPQTAEGKEAVNTPVDVDGVGDQAFFVKLNTATGTEDKTESLNARFGRQVIVLTATRLAGIDHQSMQDQMTKLAKKL